MKRVCRHTLVKSHEKFPGLRTPSPSPRHLRQAIDLIGLIKRVYYLVALAWAYGWVKAIGQFIESLDSVVKKRRSEEEKGGCPPKKNARDLCGKSHTKNCSLQDILSPNICMKRLLHQAWPLLHPLSPPPDKRKDDLRQVKDRLIQSEPPAKRVVCSGPVRACYRLRLKTLAFTLFKPSALAALATP